MRDDISLYLHSIRTLCESKLALLKKFEFNLHTIYYNIINENEEAIVTLLVQNNELIEDICAINYDIAYNVQIVTSKLGLEYTKFESFITKIENEETKAISANIKKINETLLHLKNLYETLQILMNNRHNAILRNLQEIHNILELQRYMIV